MIGSANHGTHADRNGAATQLRRGKWRNSEGKITTARVLFGAPASAVARFLGEPHERGAGGLRVARRGGKIQPCHLAVPTQIDALGIDAGEAPALALTAEENVRIQRDRRFMVLV